MNTQEIKSDEVKAENDGGGKWIWLFAVAHLLCCGLPLLLLSGISLATFFKSNAAIAIGLAILGVIGFMWYLKRGCATCPRNEGRCIGGECKTSTKNVQQVNND